MDLLGGTIKEMMEAEMDERLGYQQSERSDNDDARNGYKSKRINTSYGSMEIDVPQDRKSTFEPQVVKKRQKDILILCADGLTGIKEAIAAAFPKTDYQRCMVHMVRNILKFVADKDKKAYAKDLKTIYNAPSEQAGRDALDRVRDKWEDKYPRSTKRWYDNWDAVSPIFKFSADVRIIVYTTNAIESLNATYRKLNRQRSVFPSDKALLKALYLSTFEATKKWYMPIRNWGKAYGEMAIMYEGRLPE